MSLSRDQAKYFLVVFFLGILLFLAGCNNERGISAIMSDSNMDIPPSRNVNEPPVIECINCSDLSVRPGGTVNLCVTASDPRDETLSYHFACSEGALEINGCTATWTLPIPEGRYHVNVLVSDGINYVHQSIYIDVTIYPPRFSNSL